MSTAPVRPYHHGNLRAELLRCAERTLDAGGVQALSLRELARELGVSHAAPRRHFAGKQALLDALALDGFERLGAALEAAVTGAGERFEDRLAALARTYVRFATDHAPLLELMFAGKHAPGADPRLRAASDRAFAVALDVIPAGQAAGEVVAGDPDEVAVVVFAALQGLATLTTTGLLDPASLDATATAVSERLVLGLRPR